MIMSEEDKTKTALAKEKLQSGTAHAKAAFEVTAEAAKTAAESVKQQAQGAYEVGKDHISKAANDLGEAATATYEDIRQQAGDVAGQYRTKAEIAWSEAGAKAKNFQSEAEQYVREQPLKAIGFAFLGGLILGLISRR